MASTEFEISFQYDYLTSEETDSVEMYSLIPIRIRANDIYITGSDEEFQVDDFLYPNINKMVGCIPNLLNNERSTVQYHGVVRDLTFVPAGQTVRVSFCSRDGTPHNPDAPSEGVPVEKRVVIEEILNASAELVTWLTELDAEIEDQALLEKLEHKIDAAETEYMTKYE